MRGGALRRAGSGGTALLLLLLLALEIVPCICFSFPDTAAPDGPPSVARLRVCGGADYAGGALGDQSLLRSDPPVPLPPALARAAAPLRLASLPEGHPPPVDRPPRLAV